MELRHLRYFVAVAEEMNFSRAAQRLYIAQPPLSNQIKQLEEELGVKLFDRRRGGVRLTEAGQLLLEEARQVLVQLDQTTRMVGRVGSGKVGRLTLGFVPSASNNILPRFLQAFREDFPDVELYLHEMNPDQLVDRLHDKRIDVAFFYLPFEDSTLDFKPVLREPLVVALPESHPLAAQPEVDLQALSEEPFILHARYQMMDGLYSQVMEVCRQAGFIPRAVQKEVWLMQTIVGLVAGDIGVALVPASLRNLHRSGVVYKEVGSLSPTVEMGVVWRRGDTSAVLGAFLGVVEESSPLIQGPVGDEGPAISPWWGGRLLTPTAYYSKNTTGRA